MKLPRVPALLAALLVATAAVYLPGVDGDFVFDDGRILGSPLVSAPLEHGLGEWLSASRPVTDFTFALNRLAVGTDTRGWHLTNIAIHLCAVILGWAFLRRTLTRAGSSNPDLSALAAAALFALHPLQTESVAYLTQRAEALAAAIYLAALLLLLARDEAVTPVRRNALLGGAILLQAVGALTKPIVATLPAAWLLHAAILPAPGERALTVAQRLRRRLAAAAPLLALSIASAARELAGVATTGSRSAGFSVPDLSPLQYLATQLRVVPTYLGLALWPAGQCADWPFPASAGLTEPGVVAGAVLLLAIVAAAIWMTKRAAGQGGDGPAAARAAAFGLLFFLATLAPTSSFVPLIDPLAEHRVYLGLLGLSAAAAACGAWAVRRYAGGRAWLVGALVALAVSTALGVATARRASVWTSAIALWTDAAGKAPGKARVQSNLGVAYHRAGRYSEALGAQRRARALLGDHTVAPGNLLLHTVNALTMLRRFDEARAELAAALQDAPRSSAALGLLAQVEFAARRGEAAEGAAKKALEVDPSNVNALKILGNVRAMRGDLRSARDLFRTAAATGTGDSSVHLALGQAEEQLGDRAAACAAYLRAATEPRGGADVAASARGALRALGCR